MHKIKPNQQSQHAQRRTKQNNGSCGEATLAARWLGGLSLGDFWMRPAGAVASTLFIIFWHLPLRTSLAAFC